MSQAIKPLLCHAAVLSILADDQFPEYSAHNLCFFFIYSVLHLIPILVARCGPVSELVPAHSDNGYIVVARFNSHCLLKMILVGLGLTEPLAKNS